LNKKEKQTKYAFFVLFNSNIHCIIRNQDFQPLDELFSIESCAARDLVDRCEIPAGDRLLFASLLPPSAVPEALADSSLTGQKLGALGWANVDGL
jgi:hypothetical protein